MSEATPAARPLYVAVVLDEDSREKLLRWWGEEVGTKVLSKEFAHHMTLVFKPTEKDMERFLDGAEPEYHLGARSTLRVDGWADDGCVQAVAVFGLETTNKVSHVTVATDGRSPKFSNDLLERGINDVNGPVLHGTVTGIGKQR